MRGSTTLLRGYRYTIARMRWRLGAGQGDTMADLTGKRALVIVEGYGTEEPELLQPVEFLRERGAEVDIAAAQNPIDCVTGDRYDSQRIVPDKMLAETGAEGYDVLIVPGGTVNMDRLRINPEAHRIMREFMEAKKVVACICHGPWLLVNAGVAEGKTVIENAAKEPHVVDVANFLNSMGANIRGAGTDVIRIVGVEKLHKTSYSVIPDQIEAGTFMCAAAATKGDVLIKNVIPKHLEATSAKLIEAGCMIEEFDDAVRIVANKGLTHTQITTLPYPGFPTDMQPQMTVVLGMADGTSTVTESIFENRFKYVDELSRMGADIKVESNIAIIRGIKEYTGARVSAPDLRAGAALVIAGLAADGITIVEDIHFIQRGYEDFEIKLRSLGAQIERTNCEKEIQKFMLRVS